MGYNSVKNSYIKGDIPSVDRVVPSGEGMGGTPPGDLDPLPIKTHICPPPMWTWVPPSSQIVGALCSQNDSYRLIPSQSGSLPWKKEVQVYSDDECSEDEEYIMWASTRLQTCMEKKTWWEQVFQPCGGQEFY